MRENNLLEPDVDLDFMAENTVNYTGAEIEAVVRSAAQYALFKDVNLNTGSEASTATKDSVASKIQVDKKKDKKKEKFVENKVSMDNFMLALNEIPPAFGTDNFTLENKLLGGFYNYSKTFDTLHGRCMEFLKEIEHSQKTQLLTLLLDGPQRCGKTALASKLALESKFPFIQMISPE